MKNKLTKVDGFYVKVDYNANGSFVINFDKPNGEKVQLYMNSTDIHARFYHNNSWTFKDIANI